MVFREAELAKFKSQKAGRRNCFAVFVRRNFAATHAEFSLNCRRSNDPHRRIFNKIERILRYLLEAI